MINTKFMNKIKILVISGLMFFSGTYLTAAQAAISLSSNLAEARIVAPLGFTVSGTLSFGQIAKPAVGAIYPVENRAPGLVSTRCRSPYDPHLCRHSGCGWKGYRNNNYLGVYLWDHDLRVGGRLRPASALSTSRRTGRGRRF